MEPHKHGYLFRERDVGRVIAQYGRKPQDEIRSRMIESLRDEREKFLRLEQFRGQERSRSRGHSI